MMDVTRVNRIALNMKINDFIQQFNIFNVSYVLFNSIEHFYGKNILMTSVIIVKVSGDGILKR